MNDQPENLAAALGQLQANLPHITKDQIANAERFSYAYADLAQISRAVLPMLAPLGLAWITKPTVSAEGKFVLNYALIHVSGEREEGSYPLNPAGTPQQRGSEISYARRYSLCSVLGVAPEADDDGAAASAQSSPRARSTNRRNTRASTQDEPADETSLRGMFADLRDHGYADKDPEKAKALQLGFICSAIGREITSRKELTGREVAMVRRALAEGDKDDHSETPS